MIPDLLRDCEVGLLLVRRTSTHLDVVDANRAAVRLLTAGSYDVRGTVRSGTGIGRVARLGEAIELATAGSTSRWCTSLAPVVGGARHLNVRVTPFDEGPDPLALVQLSEPARRHDTCALMETVQ